MNINFNSINKITAGNITEEKLYGELKIIQELMKLDYVEKASSISKRLIEGEEVNIDEIAYIRKHSTLDKNNLKGDYLIAIFLYMEQNWKTNKKWGKGRTMIISNEDIYKIFNNELKEVKNVRQFCRDNNITKETYYKIKNNDVKQEKTIKQIQSIKSKIVSK